MYIVYLQNKSDRKFLISQWIPVVNKNTYILEKSYGLVSSVYTYMVFSRTKE